MSNNYIHDLFTRNQQLFSGIPHRNLHAEFVERLFDLLFGSYKFRFENSKQLEKEYLELQEKLYRLLDGVIKDEEKKAIAVLAFFEQLPGIHQRLLIDAEAALLSDPAAQSLEEVFLTYPGFFATAVYRFSHQLLLQDIPLLPRLISEYAHSKTGIDIHPGAEIGNAFVIDHGTGVVIGETSIVGSNVKIYQGVTLGALNVSKSNSNKKRHPTIEDNVTIYSGATILGGQTVIGHDSIIGGNVWLTYSVPAFSVAYHKSEVKVRDNNPFPDPVNFVI